MFYIHFCFDAKKTKAKNIKTTIDKPIVVAGDWGTTELFTFSNGDIFYPDNGKKYRELAEALLIQQRQLSGMELKRRRNKQSINYNAFQLVQNQDINNFVFVKAKSNCAFKKLNRQISHYQLKQANDLANYLININADEFVYENINVRLLKEESKCKNNRNRAFRRQVNSMTLRSFIDKVTAKVTQCNPRFKAIAINPAYSSQTCPCCGYVDNRSRHGDKFCCLSCRFVPKLNANCRVIPQATGATASEADYVAALNLLHRYMCVDALVGIHQYTPKQKVREKLLQLYEVTKQLGIDYKSVGLNLGERRQLVIQLSHIYSHKNQQILNARKNLMLRCREHNPCCQLT